MKKSYLSLTVAVIIAAILVAGCSTQNQTNQGPSQTVSTNASTSSTSSSTSKTASSSVVSASPTVSPTPSASPTASTSPTPTPQPSGKIATSIYGTQSFNSNPTITRNSPVSWGFEVVPTGKAQILAVPVTIRIDNKAIGQVTPVSGSTESVAFSLTSAETNSLAAGQHTLTVSYAGDSTYQPSEQSFQITVT